MANPLLAGGSAAGEDVQISSGGDSIDAYFAKPTGAGAAPGVVVIHENRGLVPYLREVADGLASSGYMAVAPDLLTREGGTDTIKDVPPVLSEVPRERHTNDALAAIQFRFGGAVTWRVAVASADLDAAVPFYGSNPPLEGVKEIKAAVFAVYGELDERINAGIDDMMSALQAAGTTHDHKVYAGAPHAFHNHTNAERHNAVAAKEAWADALAWFDKHLK